MTATKRIPRIVILGANGQVGTEMCLFLQARGDCEPVAVSRSEYGTVLLRRAGIRCVHGSVSDPVAARRLLEGSDLVVDLTLPTGGNPRETRRLMKNILAGAFHGAPAGVPIAYTSTLAVDRFSHEDRIYRIYAINKLYAERVARNLGRETRRDVYILRLGQVHGILQGCSSWIAENMRDKVAVVPDIPSFVVFVFTISEAVANIARGLEEPGTYALTAAPPWSWEEVHRYYCDRAGLESKVALEPVNSESFASYCLKRGRGFLLKVARDLADANSEALSDLLARVNENLETRARFWKTSRTVGKQLEAHLAANVWRPYRQEFVARGARLRSLSDARVTMARAEAAVTERVSGLVSDGAATRTSSFA